ncbi:MAG TPA: hypothetical protein VHS80_08420 [Chthoniobacterales bacterium]|nr:hypothetical protein [Chthoniobacterales bacterium]
MGWPIAFCGIAMCTLVCDPATHLIYFGYGGQNAGFDQYERVGIMQVSLAWNTTSWSRI